MQKIESTKRSSLFYDPENSILQRVYHDTNKKGDPYFPSIDERGCERCSHNRCIPSMMGCPSRPVPPRIWEVRSSIYKYKNVPSLSSFLNVKESTTWGYLCQVAESFPEADLTSFVKKDILEAVVKCEDKTGSLKSLLQKSGLSSHPEVREMEDRYAHLRLARLICT